MYGVQFQTPFLFIIYDITTMKGIALVLVAVLFTSLPVHAQSTNELPKHDFRGVWVATVLNLDWPALRTASPASQREDLIRKFDRMQEAGMNVIFFQVRTEMDALYQSPYEPWSFYLTGQEGRAPNPLWDPLEFAIEEAHKRGMELHAWLNPYRAVRNATAFTRASTHVSVTNPEWILRFGNLQILNPGLPEVIDYTTKIVMDIVRRYNVDGIHFDDYFYPYAPNTITNEDAATFAEHGGDFTNIGDWRRDNINRMIQAVHDSIKAVKPHVKFGISPFGIWRPGHPQGIVGTDAYATIFADAKAWIADESVDYLVPQLYWAFGGGQDYARLAPWWAGERGTRHMYTGNAVYKMEGTWNWPTSEIGNQVRFNRNTPGIYGQTYFRSRLIQNNLKGIRDSLRTDWQRHPALPPVMDWLDMTPPPAPENLSAERINNGQSVELSWDRPEFNRAGGDSLLRFAIYRVNSATIPDAEEVLGSSSNLIAITGLTTFIDEPEVAANEYYYFVTAFTRNGIENLDPQPVSIRMEVSTPDPSQLPSRIELMGNFPNPFNPATSIRFRLPESTEVRVTVFDSLGRSVAVLTDQRLPAGEHQVSFDAAHLTSGVYMYTLEANGERFTGKMMLLK